MTNIRHKLVNEVKLIESQTLYYCVTYNFGYTIVVKLLNYQFYFFNDFSYY